MVAEYNRTAMRTGSLALHRLNVSIEKGNTKDPGVASVKYEIRLTPSDSVLNLRGLKPIWMWFTVIMDKRIEAKITCGYLQTFSFVFHSDVSDELNVHGQL